jgi:hypothetical protein
MFGFSLQKNKGVFMKDDGSCHNKYCFHYGKGLFCYNCRVAERKGSSAFVQDCRVYKEIQKDHKEIKKFLEGI